MHGAGAVLSLPGMRVAVTWNRVLFAVCASLLLLAAAWLLLHRQTPSAARATSGYVDPQTCVRCHRDEAAGYAETGMARSFYIPTPAVTVDSPAKGRVFYHQASSSWYTLTAHDGRYFQRRWQKGFDGSDDNVEELSIDYVMGSGNHARTYLHREQDGTLIELPLAWYAENGGEWGMNPGFDNAAPMTRRVIAYECMFCHNAYPQVPATAHRDLSAKPVYTAVPMGIDCQRCHGPGAAHVRAAEAAKPSNAQIRATILNPAHLSSARQMEVCEQCHLETTSTLLPDRVRHYDRQPFGYDPSQPLSAFNAYFTRDPAHGRTDNVEIVNAAYRLRQSKCYLASRSALTCETCHDPHDLHKGPQSAAFYANICLGCHAKAIRSMVAQRKHTDSDECVACHMPQRRTDDVVHAVMTDHLIQRRAPIATEALAPRAESTARYTGPVVRYVLDGEQSRPDDALYNALAQVIDKSNVAQGIPALSTLLNQEGSPEPNAYIELGDAQRHNGQAAPAIASYRRALELDPQSSRAARRLGVALGEAGQAPVALRVLGDAIGREPANEFLLYERAQIEAGTGDSSAATADLRKALTLKPDYADALNNLGSLQASGGDASAAQSSYRAALAVNPYDAGTHANLGRLLAATGSWPEAAFQFDRAIALAPADPGTRLDYAIALLQAGQVAPGEAQVRAALKLAPRDARGLDLLGQIYLIRGQTALARAQFQASVEADPAFAPAQLDLAETLLESGDVRGAEPWLERARQSRLPAISQRAAELLARSSPK